MVQVQPKIGETIQGGPLGQGNANVAKKSSVQGRTIMSADLPSGVGAEKKNLPEDSNSEVPKKKSHWLMWLIIILVLLGLGVGAYFFIFKGKLGLF